MKTDAEWKELYDNASASEYYEERWKDASAQLTAAEEQLAEMRKYARHKYGCHLMIDAGGRRRPDLPKRGCSCGFDKALSAAPKRGRVLWEAKGRIWEEASYHEDERSSYHYTAYYVEPLKITDFDSFLVGTDLDAKCKWLYDGLLVTVTVREAE